MAIETEHKIITRKRTRTEQEDKNWNYPETRTTRMPKTGVEPEWSNNDQSSTYIGFGGLTHDRHLAFMHEFHLAVMRESSQLE